MIAGHVDSRSGPAVFHRLRDLRRGNVIRIQRDDGSAVRFRVEGLERWPKARFPTRRVFGATRGSVLRLTTCSGDFDASVGHYVDNTIVYAARVPVRLPRRALHRLVDASETHPLSSGRGTLLVPRRAPLTVAA